ncbi:MAG: DUF4012 domain-containing protein [Actinobacteria bacterium]|nr:DUF4012 domain-containing protein [Actinomycetota bacterium]
MLETLNTSRARSGRNGHKGGTSSAEQRRSRAARSGQHTARAERIAIYCIAAAAAVGGALAAGAPTATTLLNVLFRAGLAFGVTQAASRARRWSWLVMSGVAVIAAEGAWLAVAAVALVLAVGFCFLVRRRVYGAAVGALAIQSLLRLPPLDEAVGSALVAAVAVVPVLASAYLSSPRRIRRRAKRAVLAAIAVAGLGAAVLGIAVLFAYSSTRSAAAQTKAGVASIRDGKTPQATQQLQSAEQSFASAHGVLSGWWMWPAKVVPIVSLQAGAFDQVAEQGAAVAGAASEVTRTVDYESLRQQKGQVNVAKIKEAQAPLAQAASALDGALERTRAVRSAWLAPPLAGGIDEFEGELVKVRGETVLAAQASQVLPGMLGADGTRRYFVAFITPAEERGLGGFMGNWAELTASDGKIAITASGRAANLNSRSNPDAMVVTSDADYAARYGKYRPGRYMQDVTLSPDLPTVTKVIAELYPKLGGSQIDGVLAIDPYGLAALLELTGPIKVKGLDTPLSAKNAVEILTKQQYFDFDSRAERTDFLDEAGKRTFTALFKGDLPGPRKLSDVLSPAVDAQRVRFWSLRPEDQPLLKALGVDGTFNQGSGDDFFSLRTQNKSNNKIDIFLERKVRYDVTIDPVTRTASADVTITLYNGAPASGLPDAIIGSNDQQLAKGTNAINLSFYSPLGLREARIDDTPTGMEYQRELGLSVYSRYLELPPGGTATIKLSLFGSLRGDDDGAYQLDVAAQPMVNADQVVVSAKVNRPYRFAAKTMGDGPGLAVDQGGADAFAAFTPVREVDLAVDVVER